MRPADEAARCPAGSLFEMEGEPYEVTPTSCPVRWTRGSRSAIPVPTDSPAHRMFRLYATKLGRTGTQIIRLCCRRNSVMSGLVRPQ